MSGGSFTETPPRTWGRRAGESGRCASVRNTPTDVGKTNVQIMHICQHKKHLHGRGEDATNGPDQSPSVETPPRTWGRPSRQGNGLPVVGNTPTDVGKTRRRPTAASCTRKHPHGRGEDTRPFSEVAETAETPPRTWGRPGNRHGGLSRAGNTPTDVGKTLSW